MASPSTPSCARAFRATAYSALYGILNGTCNYILTEIEKTGAAMETMIAEAQRLGYAEADPSADVDGYDARQQARSCWPRSPSVRRSSPRTSSSKASAALRRSIFSTPQTLKHTIRLICGGRKTPDGLILSVRPALIPTSTILASVQGAYNAVWVKGKFGEDTFYYGWGAGSLPTGVAVVSDLMRVAREIRSGSPERVSPFAHERLGDNKPLPIARKVSSYYLRFRVNDRPGIIAKLAGILAAKKISLEAVLQEPGENPHDLPFVMTLEPTSEESVQEAVAEMAALDFMTEAPLAMPIETAL